MSPDTVAPAAPEVDLTELLSQLHDDADARREAGAPAGFAVLRALQAKHVYAGTVEPGVIAHRRAKAKAARKARRITRRTR